MIIPFHCSPVCTHRNRKLLNFTLFQAQKKYHTVILSFSFSEREGTLAKSACSKPCLPVVCFRSVTFQGLSQAASVQTLWQNCLQQYLAILFATLSCKCKGADTPQIKLTTNIQRRQSLWSDPQKREKLHISNEFSGNPGIAPHSCTAVLHTWKEQVRLPNVSFSFSVCTALFRFLQTTAPLSTAAACPRSSAVVTQPASMDFKCLFHPLENPSASWKYFPLLPPRLPHKHTQTHPHTWGMEWVQNVFLNSGSNFSFPQTSLEGKLWKLSKANVPGARGMSVKNS